MNAESNTPDTELDGFAQLEALLESEDDTQAPEADEAPADPEEASQEDSQEESEQEQEEGTEEEEDDEQPEEAKLQEIEIDGKKLSVEEVKAGYLRQQDYTRKTQEAAEIRKTATAELEQTRQMRSEYQNGLRFAEHVLRQFAPQPPDQRLLDDDPIEFMRQERRFNEQMQQYQAVQANQQRLAYHEQQEQERQAAQALEKARAELPEHIPAWKDAKTAEKERPEIAKYLLAEGYAPDEVNSVSDPRAVKMVRKAWLYDQLIAQKKQAKPVVTKVTQPGASRKPSSDTNRAKQMQRLKQTGRLEDAVGILENLI